MAVTLNNYGKVDWTDYTDFWRDDDAEWLMTRSILRYATAATRSTDIPTPEIGQVTYRDDADVLELRSKASKWVPVAAAQNLVVTPTSSASNDDPVTLKQQTATGGLVLGKTKVSTTLDFDMGNGAVVGGGSGLTIKTGAGTSLLTTTATHLKSSLPIEASAGISNINYVQANNVNVDGTLTADNLTVTPGVISAAAGISLGAGTTSAADRAARKDYVDAAITSLTASVNSGYVHKTGDTMTDWLNIRQTTSGASICQRFQAITNTPYFDFYNYTGTARYAYIQGTASQLHIVSDVGDIVLNSGGSQVRASDGVWMTGQMRAFISGNGVVCAGPSSNSYVSWYSDAANVDTLGTRSGFMGYPGSNTLYISNEITSSSIIYKTDYAHAFQVDKSSPVEVCRIQPGLMLFGKTGSDLNSDGIEIIGGGGSAQGSIRSTISTPNQNLYCRHVSGGDVNGAYFIQFVRSTVTIGGIQQIGTTGVNYGSTCDYRIKDNLGPVEDAIDKVMRLRPHRALYHGDEQRGVVDVFTAHELAEIVPDAVTGTKDQVDAEGNPEIQDGDYAKVVPLLTAAVQELVAEIAALKGAA